MSRLVCVRSISTVAVALLVPVGLLGLESVSAVAAQAVTTCAEPSAPCVASATLKGSILRVKLASSTKVVRVSWVSPSGKPVTKPLLVRKGVAAITIAGIKLGSALPLSIQGCTSTKLKTCGPAASWTMQIEVTGAVGVSLSATPPAPPLAPSAPLPAVTVAPTPLTTPPATAPSATVATTQAPTTQPATTIPATTVVPTTTSLKLKVAELSVKVGAGVTPALQLFKGSCKTGFVKRNAAPDDTVCVTPESATRAFIDNEAAKSRIAVSSSGPDGCRPGFVWREAYSGDVTCVTPQSKQEAQSENDPKLNLSRKVLFNGPDTCRKGFVWRNAGGSIDRICVTPEEKQLIDEEGSEWDLQNLPSDNCPFNLFLRNIYDLDDVCVSAARKLKINRDNLSRSTKEIYSMSGPADSCRTGFVWRMANGIDHICVTPARAAAVLSETFTLKNRIFSSGPATCADGFVWRFATLEDQVCVLPATADETQRENSSAKTRVN